MLQSLLPSWPMRRGINPRYYEAEFSIVEYAGDKYASPPNGRDCYASMSRLIHKRPTNRKLLVSLLWLVIYQVYREEDNYGQKNNNGRKRYITECSEAQIIFHRCDFSCGGTTAFANSLGKEPSKIADNLKKLPKDAFLTKEEAIQALESPV